MPPVASPALPRYVELVRVSSSGQAARDTPEDQRAALDRLRLSRPGVLVERIEVAEGISGALPTAERPDLRRLASLVGRFDEVRVRHLDRLTRHDDPDEQEAVFGIIRRSRAVIVEADGTTTDPRTIQGRIVSMIKAEGAAEERRKIVERTRAAKDRLVREGRLVNGRPPFARTYDRKTGAWSIDEGAAGVLRRIFDLCLAGRSLRDIVRALDAAGTPSSSGGAWSPAQVSRLLRDRASMGEYVTQGVNIRIPPVVDEATFLAAGERLRTNNSASGPAPKHPALLRKLLTCGVCGAPLYTVKGGRTRRPGIYYLCSSRDPACSAYHRIARVDAAVREAVEAWLRRPAILRAGAGVERPEDEAKRAREDAAQARRQLRKLASEEERTARLLTRGQIEEATGEMLLGEVAARRRAAQAVLADAEAREHAAARRTEVAADLEARVAELRAGLARATFADWRALMEILVPRSPATGVQIWPDGRVLIRGVVSLDDAGEARLVDAARPAVVLPLRLEGRVAPIRRGA